jgi:hypothetical protein
MTQSVQKFNGTSLDLERGVGGVIMKQICSFKSRDRIDPVFTALVDFVHYN